MHFCENPSVESWSPDFSSSGLPNPAWLRLIWRGVELSNSINWLDWAANPVQVQLCEQCGVHGCAEGGLVDVSVLGDMVLWTRPRAASPSSSGGPGSAASFLRQFGALAFAAQEWNRLKGFVEGMPAITEFPRATGHDLLSAWICGPGRPSSVTELQAFLRRQVEASDTLNATAATQAIQTCYDRLAEAGDEPFHAELIPISTCDARSETIYFQGHSSEAWTAIASIGTDWLPVFADTHVLIPRANYGNIPTSTHTCEAEGPRFRNE